MESRVNFHPIFGPMPKTAQNYMIAFLKIKGENQKKNSHLPQHGYHYTSYRFYAKI